MDKQVQLEILAELQKLNAANDRLYGLLDRALSRSHLSVSLKTHAISIAVFAAMMVLSQLQLYELKKVTLTGHSIEVNKHNESNK